MLARSVNWQAATALVLLLVAGLPASAEERPEAAALKAVQGKWQRQVQTSNGLVKLLKEHAGNKSVVTAYDADGNVVYAHESEFKIEPSDKTLIFTFFNRKTTAGPQAGEENKQPVSFVFRVEGGRFVEAYGLLENDPSPPAMAVWQRP